MRCRGCLGIRSDSMVVSWLEWSFFLVNVRVADSPFCGGAFAPPAFSREGKDAPSSGTVQGRWTNDLETSPRARRVRRPGVHIFARIGQPTWYLRPYTLRPYTPPRALAGVLLQERSEKGRQCVTTQATTEAFFWDGARVPR